MPCGGEFPRTIYYGMPRVDVRLLCIPLPGLEADVGESHSLLTALTRRYDNKKAQAADEASGRCSQPSVPLTARLLIFLIYSWTHCCVHGVYVRFTQYNTEQPDASMLEKLHS